MNLLPQIWSDISSSFLFGDLLTVGSVGFLVGVLVPLGFRLLGMLFDSVHAVLYTNDGKLER